MRDIAIIVLALESIVIGVALIVLAFQIYRLVKLIEQEVKPILESAQRTTQTVEGTASVIGESVVTPVAKAIGFTAAVREVIKVLAGRRK